jgi:hypothetical protein
MTNDRSLRFFPRHTSAVLLQDFKEVLGYWEKTCHWSLVISVVDDGVLVCLGDDGMMLAAWRRGNLLLKMHFNTIIYL